MNPVVKELQVGISPNAAFRIALYLPYDWLLVAISLMQPVLSTE